MSLGKKPEKDLIPAKKYAEETGREETDIVEMIRKGELPGINNENTWFVDLEKSSNIDTMLQTPIHKNEHDTKNPPSLNGLVWRSLIPVGIHMFILIKGGTHTHTDNLANNIIVIMGTLAIVGILLHVKWWGRIFSILYAFVLIIFIGPLFTYLILGIWNLISCIKGWEQFGVNRKFKVGSKISSHPSDINEYTGLKVLAVIQFLFCFMMIVVFLNNSELLMDAGYGVYDVVSPLITGILMITSAIGYLRRSYYSGFIVGNILAIITIANVTLFSVFTGSEFYIASLIYPIALLGFLNLKYKDAFSKTRS